MAIELLRSLLQQATASGTKSTVLSELRWCLGFLIAGLLGVVKAGSSIWLQIMFAVLVCVVFVVYVVAYSYFAVKAPDYLRTEKYSLSKLAIERSVTGDNLSGFVDPMLESTAKSLSLSTPPEGKK